MTIKPSDTITIPRKLADALLRDFAAVLGEVSGKTYAGRGCCNLASVCDLADLAGYETSDPDMNQWIRKNRKQLDALMAENPGEFVNLGEAAAVLHSK